MAKKAKAKTPGMVDLSLDAEGLVTGISRIERIKAFMKGTRRLHMEMNIRELKHALEPVQKAVEGAGLSHAVPGPDGPIPAFVALKPRVRLDFNRYAGQWKEGEYPAGSIVLYANRFMEAEDTTSEKPPGSTWAHIGDRGHGHEIENWDAFRAEVKEIEGEEHPVKLYTVPAALYADHEIDEAWLEITDMD